MLFLEGMGGERAEPHAERKEKKGQTEGGRRERWAGVTHTVRVVRKAWLSTEIPCWEPRRPPAATEAITSRKGRKNMQQAPPTPEVQGGGS